MNNNSSSSSSSSSSSGDIENIVLTINSNTYIVLKKIALYSKLVDREYIKSGRAAITLEKEILPADILNILSSQDKILEKIVEFLSMYDKDPLDLNSSTNMSSNLGDKCSSYINFLDDKYIISILKLSNFLEIKPLVLLCGTKISSIIKSSSLDKLREIFGEKDDLTPEDKTNIEIENKWIEN